MKDYYAILGVSKDARAEEIKASYRKLAKRYHPDLHPGDKEAEARFKEINEAYATLGDTGTKAKYDLDRRKEAEKARTSQAANQRPKKAASRAPVNPDFDFTNMAQGFESFFGFNPATGDITDESKLNSNVNKQNPLDMSKMFEDFFGFKK